MLTCSNLAILTKCGTAPETEQQQLLLLGVILPVTLGLENTASMFWGTSWWFEQGCSDGGDVSAFKIVFKILIKPPIQDLMDQFLGPVLRSRSLPLPTLKICDVTNLKK